MAIIFHGASQISCLYMEGQQHFFCSWINFTSFFQWLLERTSFSLSAVLIFTTIITGFCIQNPATILQPLFTWTGEISLTINVHIYIYIYIHIYVMKPFLFLVRIFGTDKGYRKLKVLKSMGEETLDKENITAIK